MAETFHDDIRVSLSCRACGQRFVEVPWARTSADTLAFAVGAHLANCGMRCRCMAPPGDGATTVVYRLDCPFHGLTPPDGSRR